ncbi:Pr6Pr family membrane protein [Gordonia defluvii]|uniref:Pr6Pr family membrane protein n=1 Tax=Gordonia defluvii TaxID=283718 RepID=A0ABP6KYM2_9ACTN|nr:Pr6Pr family membrane protein [Gordonia sp. UBA5067]
MPSTRNRVIWNLLRLAMSGVIVAAVAAQFASSVDVAAAYDRDAATTVGNFFSFFTILSNLAAAAVLMWSSLWWFSRGRRTGPPEPRGLAIAVACVTSYMIVTGVVYNALLRGIELPQGSVAIPWSNEVLHLIGPAFLLLDLVIGPVGRRLGWRTVPVVLIFPIVWVAYTLVRGPATTNPATGDPWWYPYPFLDPNGPGGAASVAWYILAIALVIALVATGVVWVDRRRSAQNRAPRVA